MTHEQKQKIREGLKKVTRDRVGFVRWMIRIFKTVDHEVDYHYHRIGYD